MVPLRVRSMVGLIPLFAVEYLDRIAAGPCFRAFRRPRPELVQLAPGEPPAPRPPGLPLGRGRRRRSQSCRSLLRGHRMKALLRSDARRGGVSVALRRALALEGITATIPTSRFNEFGSLVHGRYDPAESTSACSAATRTGAGRSGCRLNYLIIEALRALPLLLRRRLSWSSTRPAPAIMHTLAPSPTTCQDRLIGLFTATRMAAVQSMATDRRSPIGSAGGRGGHAVPRVLPR